MSYFIVLILFCCVSAASSLSCTIIGANGRTGSKITTLALKKNWKTVALTRNGSCNVAGKVINFAGDITKATSLASAIKGSQAVFFAASASKEGGTPQQIDKDGLVNIAKLCIEYKVPRLVIISSGAVSKPFSPVYLFLNLFGGIMKAKIEGENEVRKLYADSDVKKKKLSYTIIRPGGLTEDEPRGVTAVELNQGDDRSGRISRWDVAAVAVECVSAPSASAVTIECYYKDTSQPLANVGLSNILKKTNKNSERVLTGKERNGDTWSAIFRGLIVD